MLTLLAWLKLARLEVILLESTCSDDASKNLLLGCLAAGAGAATGAGAGAGAGADAGAGALSSAS